VVTLSKELRRALNQAGELLAERERISQALLAAEESLPKLIEQRLEAQSALAEEEARAALDGDEQGKNNLKARSKLAACREALDAGTARVTGLKRRRDGQMQELALARAEVEALLPDFYQAASDEFREEWSSACALFGVTLARRFAIERATNQDLDLLPPTASGERPDTGELGMPGDVLRNLQAALLQIEAARAQEVREQREPPTFALDGVYEFARECNLDGHHWRAGDRVVGGQLTAAGFKYCTQVRLLRRLDSLVNA
jgi:hypothetical protein